MFKSHLFKSQHGFVTESGFELPELQLTYHCAGQLNEERNNVIWFFHALTGNSDPSDWWDTLLKHNPAFNAQTYFLICVNIPGSCYGSTGPLSLHPKLNRPYYHQFPILTNRDVVKAFQLLKNALGITQIELGIGGSLGGQQLIEWAITEPDLFASIVPIATNAKHSPWGIAFNTSQRWAIDNDLTFKSASDAAGQEGLKLARSIALLSYRTPEIYNQSQFEVHEPDQPITTKTFKASTYQYYQGQKLANRFNACSYYRLTQMMDLHDVGRGRDGIRSALSSIKAKTLLVSISSDWLFPVADQIFMAKCIPNAIHQVIQSDFGHDGFLVETHELNQLLLKHDFLLQIMLPIK